MDDAPRNVRVFLKDSPGDPGSRIDRLPSIEFEARGSETLESLAERAFELAGFDPLGSNRTILFVGLPGPDGGRTLVPYLDVGVNEEGVMFWRIGPGSVRTSIADVERAAAEGLFEGDPHAYSVDRGGYGDSGLIVHWDDLLRYLKDLGALGGGLIVVGKTASWMVQFLDRHLGGWRVRHARFPGTFLNSIVRRARWESDALARLLDVPEDDTRELLRALGYEEREKGVFTLSNDENKGFLRKRLAEKHFLWDGWHEIKKPASDDEPPP